MSISLETDLKKRMRRTALQSAILSSLEVAGVVTIAIMAPNILQLLGKRYKRSDNVKIRNAVGRLATKGLVTISAHGGDRRITLTQRGRAYLNNNENYKVDRPRKWDKKWRMVIFDIPETRKIHRRHLKRMLEEIGFERLQDSVWVFPYDCEDLIALLKANYGLGKEVLYIIADTIERDSDIRKKFDLV